MQVTYRLEDEDFRALAKFLLYHTPRGQRAVRRHAVSSTVLSLAAAALIYALRRDLVLALLFGVFCYVLMRVLRRTTERSALNKIYTTIRPRDARRMRLPGTLRIADEGLEAQSGPDTARIPWRGVSQIGRDATHIFVVVGRSNALVVPQREFESPDLFEAFYQHAVERHAEAYGVKGRG